MFILKKKHLEELRKKDEEIKQLKKDKSSVFDEYTAILKRNNKLEKDLDEVINISAKLENQNANLRHQLKESYKNESNYFKANKRILEEKSLIEKENNRLKTENKRLNIKSNTLERLVLRLDGEREGLGKAFNVMNNRLWCNEESKNRIRQLSNDLLNGKKIPLKDLGLALRDISMYMGGGEHLKFEEKVKANG